MSCPRSSENPPMFMAWCVCLGISMSTEHAQVTVSLFMYSSLYSAENGSAFPNRALASFLRGCRCWNYNGNSLDFDLLISLGYTFSGLHANLDLFIFTLEPEEMLSKDQLLSFLPPDFALLG